MALDIITRLRPASSRAAEIASSIALAKTAVVDQRAIIAAAKATRDNALLDSEPATLHKAEAALTEAREQGERVDAVPANLRQRHVAAVEAEALAHVADLKARTQDAYRRLSVWWIGRRAKLAKELVDGIALVAEASNLAGDHLRAQVAARHELPHLPFDEMPTVPPIDALSWPRELGGHLSWLGHDSPDPVSDAAAIAALCDPRPPGAF